MIHSYALNKQMLTPFLPLISADVMPLLDAPDSLLVGADVDGEAAGFAIVQVDERMHQTGDLLYLVTSENHRREGVADSLLRRCVILLRNFDVDAISCTVPESCQSEALDACLKKFGMVCSESDTGSDGTILLEQMLQVPALKYRESAHALPLSKIPRIMLAACSPELCDDDPWESLDPDLSYLYVKDDKILSTFLVKKRGDALCIEWMALSGAPGNSPLMLLQLIGHSLHKAASTYPPTTRIFYSVWTEAARKLIDWILGGAKQETGAQYYELAHEAFRLKDCRDPADIPDIQETIFQRIAEMNISLEGLTCIPDFLH